MSFGICHLSIIPLRKAPSDKAEIGSQLFFGDTIEILGISEDQKWVEVKSSFDLYTGWIDIHQFTSIEEDYFTSVNQSSHPFVGEMVGILRGERRTLPILFGTSLPFYKKGEVNLGSESFIFEGQIIETASNTDFQIIQKYAVLYLNSPYLWGGKSHFGIDCSGFVQQVYKLSGLKIPRDAYQQAEVGKLVGFEELKPGDLAFFHHEGKVTHVGIILENYQIIHASGMVRVDSLDEKGIFNVDRKVNTHKFHSIRRIF
jgi:hypothetical protein